MPDFDDQDHRFAIFNRVKNPVVSLAETKFFLAGELLAAWRTGIGCEIMNLPDDSQAVFSRNGLNLFGRGWLDVDVIACHAFSDP